MPQSLIALCSDPRNVQAIPTAEAIRRPGGYSALPVGALPWEAIAVDAAARGLAVDRRHHAIVKDATRLVEHQVGEEVAAILDEAANHWADLADVQRFGWPMEVLRGTARDLRLSANAQRSAVTRLLTELPTADSASLADAALTVLAEFDSLRSVRRSEVWQRYCDLGRPGDLEKGTINDLAAERWGAARKVGGIYVYRPASAALSMASRVAESPSTDHATAPLDEAALADVRAFAERHHVPAADLAAWLADHRSA